mgnify:CR=1 FL=1
MKKLGEINYIVHMAADTHVDNSISDPVPFIKNNIMSTVHILEYARTLKNLEIFKDMAYPLLIGPSRKAFIGDVLNLPPDERVEGTIATVVAGILNGANIVRVHDVKENKRAITVTENILAAK